MNDDSLEERLSQFFSAGLYAPARLETAAGVRYAPSPLAPANPSRLASLLEHAIRGGGFSQRADFGAGASFRAARPEGFRKRLIDELASAHEQMRAGARNLPDDGTRAGAPPLAGLAAQEEPAFPAYGLTEAEQAFFSSLDSPVGADETCAREMEPAQSDASQALMQEPPRSLPGDETCADAQPFAERAAPEEPVVLAYGHTEAELNPYLPPWDASDETMLGKTVHGDGMLADAQPAAERAALEKTAAPAYDAAGAALAFVPGRDPIAPAPAKAVKAQAPAQKSAQRAAIKPARRMKVEEWLQSQPAGFAQAGVAKALGQKLRNLARWLRQEDWNRWRLALLSLIHRHVFDRKTDSFLFYRNPAFAVYRAPERKEGAKTPFVYEGPIPRLPFDWALSALPRDLDRYAFIDFRAGDGRALLLAARRYFEYAAGYAFDAEGSEILEMNLARFPRTRLACRDVRALRGDRDGVVIPSQPVVLFFPDRLGGAHLDIILTYVSASLKTDPRPVFLMFENAGREEGKESLRLFEKARLPLLSQAKTYLFAPVKIAVYRSKFGMAS